MDERYETFEAVEERLQAIADEVGREDISLDDALGLYEEAAQLARHACTLSEEGIKGLYPPEEPEGDGDPAAQAAEGEGGAAGAAEAAADAAAAADGAAQEATAADGAAAPAVQSAPAPVA